jgi:RimJ/RimL family protein N-acetyltransferase
MVDSTTTLQTARLTLAPVGLADFEDSAAMWGDRDVVRYLGGRPSTRQDAWQRILRHAGHWSLLGWGYWAVRETVSGRFVGEVGFANFMREGIREVFGDTPEAGWVLAPGTHGRGFATEAMRAALAWGDERFQPRRTVCMIDPGNEASQAVAAKCGYTQFDMVEYGGEPTILYQRV